ncbi:hypothetical protein P4235_38115, partial [Bacillus thuringiensis]|nr:hypothetical protein [Bacillus thuringiensis]
MKLFFVGKIRKQHTITLEKLMNSSQLLNLRISDPYIIFLLKYQQFPSNTFLIFGKLILKTKTTSFH